MNDRITLTGISATGFHGVYDHERRDGQPFVVDLVLHLDLSHAAATDDLALTENYADLAELVVGHITGEPLNLIETLAGRIADDVLGRTRARRVDVTVHKPRAPMPVVVGDTSVTLTRTRASLPDEPREAVFSLGSNVGDRLAHLNAAVEALARTQGIDILAVSPVYETEAVGEVVQPDFLNVVVLARATLPAEQLLRRGLAIEAERGRERLIPHGPRTLDVDLITVGHETSDTDELTLPHPRAHERAFVLAPWRDVDPFAVLPGRGPVSDLLTPLGLAGVRPRGDVRIEWPR